MKNAANNTVRFLAHSVKKGDLSVSVHYSIGKHYAYVEGKRTDKLVPVVSIYANEYGSELFKIFEGETINNSDLSTDYFEKSHVTFHEDHPLYAAVLDRATIQADKNSARWAATQARRAAKSAARV